MSIFNRYKIRPIPTPQGCRFRCELDAEIFFLRVYDDEVWRFVKKKEAKYKLRALYVPETEVPGHINKTNTFTYFVFRTLGV